MPAKKTDRNEELNEAAETAKTEAAKTKAEPADSKHAYYVSAKPELVAYDLLIAGQNIRGQWDKQREHLVWRVPKELAPRFEAHINFLQGKIVKAA